MTLFDSTLEKSDIFLWMILLFMKWFYLSKDLKLIELRDWVKCMKQRLILSVFSSTKRHNQMDLFQCLLCGPIEMYNRIGDRHYKTY